MFLTTPLPFGVEWARAASRVADVTTVSRLVGDLSWQPQPGAPWLAVAPDDPRRIEFVRHPVARLRPARLFRPAYYRLEEQRVAKVLDIIERRRRIDVLHTHFFAMWQLQRLARRRGIPLVHTEHTSALTVQPVKNKAITRQGRAMAADLFRNAEVVMPVSRFLERSIREAGYAGTFEVVHNPVDTSRFMASPLPRTDRSVVIGSVGRLAPEKALDVLLEAFALLRRRNRRVRLRIIGRGPTELALRRLAASLGIEDAVRFDGFVPADEMPRLLSEFHIFASTTRIETFGVAVAEAIAAGRPIVASDSGALPELVSPDAGRLVPKGPGEVERFAAALEATIDELPSIDPGAIAATAVSRFSDAAVAERLAQVYLRAQR